MTAPLTPPHQPPNDDPWQKPQEAGATAHGAGTVAETDTRTELRQAAVVALVVALSGVLLGLLWFWLAPRVPLIAGESAVFLKDTEGEEAIGADGTFVLLALGFGVVSAALVFWFRRRGGIPLVVGLALGGLLASGLGWLVGWGLGPDDVVAQARAVGEGATFDAPLELNARGALLAWPVAAMIVHLGLTALFGPRDPEPEWVPFGPPYPPAAGPGDGPTGGGS
ncbi:ABC transporter permease [Streptomyces sp. NBC_01498]|uniref:ABC transporter permease n=1 Tax=Streptomyces sp. NBC_01498 TaxID=2975870 RepID=UPI002E7B9616|nr:ABC transporter permease [Streptomyces sp. NBC_01498]WTL27355.1 ABC transporter permease [Streptomyces sp. NBC_01498]